MCVVGKYKMGQGARPYSTWICNQLGSPCNYRCCYFLLHNALIWFLFRPHLHYPKEDLCLMSFAANCRITAYRTTKPWAKSMGEGDFRPSTARRPLDRFSWNLKYITTSRTWPRMQNFRRLRWRGWSGQIASLTHESFCLVFVSSPRPQVASLDTSPRTICHYTSFPPRKCFLGVRKMKFDSLYPKKRENWDF